MTKIWTGKP